MKTRGAVILAEALQDSHLGLEILNLGFNEIGPNGGYAICGAMANKEQLQSLNLNGNQFGVEVREGIIELLEQSNRLQALEEMDEDDSDAEDEDEDENDEVGVSRCLVISRLISIANSKCSYVLQDGEETDPETDEANENYETLNLNSTTDVNNSSLNWTLSSMINQEESSLENLQENTAVGFCNEVKPTAQQFTGLKDEANIDAFRKYLQVCNN